MSNGHLFVSKQDNAWGKPTWQLSVLSSGEPRQLSVGHILSERGEALCPPTALAEVGKLVKVQAEDNYSSAGLLKAGFYGFKAHQHSVNKSIFCTNPLKVSGPLKQFVPPN